MRFKAYVTAILSVLCLTGLAVAESDDLKALLDQAKQADERYNGDQTVLYATKALAKDPESWEARRYLGKGLRHLSQWQKALKCFDEAIEKFPREADLYASRGSLYYAMDDAKRAIKDATQAIELSNGEPKYYCDRSIYNVAAGENERADEDLAQAEKFLPYSERLYETQGWVAEKRGQYPVAVAYMTKAINVSQGQLRCLLGRATVHMRSRRFGEAVADCTTALEKSLDCPFAFFLRAMSYVEEGDNKKALSDLNEAIRLSPSNAMFYSERGFVFSRTLEYAKAIDDYTKAIESGDVKLKKQWFIYRGLTYADKGDYEKAIPDLSKATENESDRFRALAARADAYTYLKKYEEALADCDDLIAEDSQDGRGFGLRGVVYASKGDYSRAVDDLTAAIRLSPRKKYWHLYWRSYANLRLERYDQAERDYAKTMPAVKTWLAPPLSANMGGGVELSSPKCFADISGSKPWPNEALHFGLMAWVRLQEEDFSQAEFLCERGLEVDPKSDVCYYCRASSAAKQGKPEAALPDYSKAIELKPTVAAYYVARAKAYVKLKKWPEAQADCEAALKIDPKNEEATTIKEKAESMLKK